MYFLSEQLAIKEKKLKEVFPHILKEYCEADPAGRVLPYRPFTSPYYWAGFINQGMA